MRCTKPRTVSQSAPGLPLNWRPKDYNPKHTVFQLPCGKCIECRLDYSMEWATRCVHEAQMHEHNCFITLTYSEEHLKCRKLQYGDFQCFIERVRYKFPDQKIAYKVVGEYGERTKRPHWHSLIFGWRPQDLVPLYKNENGDQLFKSQELDNLWGKNDSSVRACEVGQVDFKSAAYVMRYSAKKLVHGLDQDHDFHPISRGSNHYAIGKRFIESYWPDIFARGFVVSDSGAQLPIPRYYKKWLERHEPEAWSAYVTGTRAKIIQFAKAIRDRERRREHKANDKRLDRGCSTLQRSRNSQRAKINEEKFKRLQQYLKGDI